MAQRRVGRRHRLLLYGHVMSRYRRRALLLALLLLGLWYPVSLGLLWWPRPPADAWLLAGGAVAAAAWLFTWLGPRLAYVQPRQDHLRLQTPIYRLKISYRRIQNVRPVHLARTFPPERVPRSHRRLLEPFYGATALGVDLHGYPLPPLLLRLFLHPLFLAPDRTGLVLIVADWMALSQDLASRLDAWRTARTERGQAPISDAARILQAEEERRPFWRR